MPTVIYIIRPKELRGSVVAGILRDIPKHVIEAVVL